jgi:hypothetical protein
VLLPFIREGIERGEKAFHIVDPRLNRHASAQENAVLVRFLEPRPI